MNRSKYAVMHHIWFHKLYLLTVSIDSFVVNKVKFIFRRSSSLSENEGDLDSWGQELLLEYNNSGPDHYDLYFRRFLIDNPRDVTSAGLCTVLT